MNTEPTTVEVGNFKVSSNTESEEQIRESLGEPEAVSEAAAALGKKGGEASAAKRAAEAKEKPEPKEVKPKAEEDEPEPDEGEETPEQAADATKLGKPRHDPKARMLEATRKEAEAKRERDAAKARADAAEKERDALRAQVAAKAPAKEIEPGPAKDAKPVQADFATYDEFVEALADYKADQKLKDWDAKAEQKAKVQEYAKGIEEQLGRAITARKEYEKTDPAWFGKVSDEVKTLANNPSIARDPEEKLQADHIIADEIILSEAVGPRLMLHFTDHPEDLQRIKALHTPTEIQVEMRILARSLNGAVTAGAAPKAQVSKASPPLRPVSGSPHTADAVPEDSDSYEEHRRYWGRKDRAIR